MRFFFKNTKKPCNVRHLTLFSFSLLLFLSIFRPIPASAHAYSASFTKITIDKKQTQVVFSIDVFSVFEIIKGIDANNNWKLEPSEIKANEHKLEEILSEGIAVDKDNRELTATVGKMKVVKKQDKDYLSIYITYPGFSPGEAISFDDGFYSQDSTANYVNLITASFMGSTSENVLQGDDRVWTMLLTEPQQEQQAPGQEQAQPTPNQDQPAKATTTSSTWLSFFKLGMFHILTGYDHLLFLISLLLRKQTFKQYAGIVTSFTLAHSITLSLAVLGLVTLPSRFVEATIAFSICYVALENIFRKEIKYRWTITFLFGLIHGLGFASLLREMPIQKSHLAVALVNFNLGIEAVQLAIVLILLPLLTYLFKLKNSRMIVKAISGIIVVLGAIWLVQRLFL